MHAGEPMQCKPCYDIAWNILIIKLENRWSSDFELTADIASGKLFGLLGIFWRKLSI